MRVLYIHDEIRKEASQVDHQWITITSIDRLHQLSCSITCFIFYSVSSTMDSSSPDHSVEEFVTNKRKHMSSSSEDSRMGWGRWKKESKKGSSSSSSVSTTLRLYEDPWKIKKILTESDLGILSRLLLAADMVRKHILPMLGGEHAKAVESEEGTQIRVWDMDTKSLHQLQLKRWSSSKSYVLIGKWSQDFVRRRELHKGDEIGFHWDPYSSLFNFCVLKRANLP